MISSNMKNTIKIFLYILSLSTICTNGTPLQGEQIEQAAENEFPFLVSLAEITATQPIRTFCGGTLISKNHILTATHCFFNYTTGLPHLNDEDVTVLLGSNDMTRCRRIGIKSWITYQQWAWERNVTVASNMYHDVSIATLTEEVTDIAPALISQCKLRGIRGRDAVTAGWGLINGVYQPRLLQKAKLQVISRKKCRLNYIKTDAPPFMVLNHLCTTSDPMVVLGCGDSGGPLLINGNELIGVNESVCANDIAHPNEQNSHQSVEYYRNFIEDFAERKAPCPSRC